VPELLLLRAVPTMQRVNSSPQNLFGLSLSKFSVPSTFWVVTLKVFCAVKRPMPQQCESSIGSIIECRDLVRTVLLATANVIQTDCSIPQTKSSSTSVELTDNKTAEISDFRSESNVDTEPAMLDNRVACICSCCSSLSELGSQASCAVSLT
jgi:hypothetical protein